jgi:transposase
MRFWARGGGAETEGAGSMRIAVSVVLSEEQRERLLQWARGRRTPIQLAERAWLILHAAAGMSDKDIARLEQCDRRTVARWRKRFVDQGLAGIERDAPRGQGNRRIPAEKIQHVLHKTTREDPPDGRRWSTRSMARAVGISEASVRRIWRSEGIAPQRQGAAVRREGAPQS